MANKITDFGIIQDAAKTVIADWGETYSTDYMTEEDLVTLLTFAYLSNDTCVEVTRRVQESGITVIVSEKRVSVILEEESSYIKKEEPLCKYESVELDLYNILSIIEATIIRVLG